MARVELIPGKWYLVNNTVMIGVGHRFASGAGFVLSKLTKGEIVRYCGNVSYTWDCVSPYEFTENGQYLLDL